MKDLLKYFRNYKKETILGPFFKLLEAIFELLVPLLIAHLVDQLIPRQDQAGMLGVVGLLFIFAGFGVSRSDNSPILFIEGSRWLY